MSGTSAGAPHIDVTPEGNFLVWFPPTTEDGRGHHVTFEASAEGARALAYVLTCRRASPREKIGASSCPTQAQVEFLMRAWAKETRAKIDELPDLSDVELEL